MCCDQFLQWILVAIVARWSDLTQQNIDESKSHSPQATPMNSTFATNIVTERSKLVLCKLPAAENFWGCVAAIWWTGEECWSSSNVHTPHCHRSATVTAPFLQAQWPHGILLLESNFHCKYFFDNLNSKGYIAWILFLLREACGKGWVSSGGIAKLLVPKIN